MLRHWRFGFVLLVLALVGCGNKGPLRLPPASTPAAPPSPPPAVAPAAPVSPNAPGPAQEPPPPAPPRT